MKNAPTPPNLNIDADQVEVPEYKLKSHFTQTFTQEEMNAAYDRYEHVSFKCGEDDFMTDEDLPLSADEEEERAQVEMLMAEGLIGPAN